MTRASNVCTCSPVKRAISVLDVMSPRHAKALAERAEDIGRFDGMAIDRRRPPITLVEELGRAVSSLGIVENESKLVAGTKTLHHLLPDLVPPMDRAYTGLFLGTHGAEWQSPANQTRIFTAAFLGLARVAREVNPQQFIGAGWYSSMTKVLDNSLIGYCIVELESPRRARTSANNLNEKVSGGGRSSYQPLTIWLAQQAEPSVTVSFKQIEHILGRALPASARNHRPWWANHAGNPQARAWLQASRHVDSVNLSAETVEFRPAQ